MQKRSLLPATPRACSIKHQLPGRIRMDVVGLKGNHRLAHGIRIAAAKLRGVTRCMPSAATGTVLIEYNPDLETADSIVDVVLHAHRSHNKWDDTFEAREVEALRTVGNVLCDCDHAIRKVSGNHIGLRDTALTLMAIKAAGEISAAGILSVAALGAGFEVLLAWILFRHPRLEREFTRLEAYMLPGL